MDSHLDPAQDAMMDPALNHLYLLAQTRDARRKWFPVGGMGAVAEYFAGLFGGVCQFV